MITGLLRFWAGRFLLVATLVALALSLVEYAKSGSPVGGAGSLVWGIAAGFVAASVSTYWMWKRTCPVPRRRGGAGA